MARDPRYQSSSSPCRSGPRRCATASMRPRPCCGFGSDRPAINTYPRIPMKAAGSSSTSAAVLGPRGRRGRAGSPPRALIDLAIGPVWEANHTWLIFDLVILWTAFPLAFASVMSTLVVPLTLAASDRAAGPGVRLPQGGGRGPDSGCSGNFHGLVDSHAVLPGRMPGRHRVGACPVGNAARDVGELAHPDLAGDRRPGRRRQRVPRRRVPRGRCPAARRRGAGGLLSPPGPRGRSHHRGHGARRHCSPARGRRVPVRGADEPRPAAGSPVGGLWGAHPARARA